MKIARIRKNVRGISPIFAVLILIAIAVIAGIVVYVFTSGMLAGMGNPSTAGQEKVTVQSASGVASTGAVSVLAQSTGGPLPTAVSIIVKNNQGNSVGSGTATAGGSWDGGVLVTVTATVTGGTGMTAGQSYTATLVTASGGSFVSPVFIAG